MADILVIFGSRSDSAVYSKILEKLDGEFHVCSAHRNPDRLAEMLKNTEAKVIIAGAGLAAHLPGVVASKVLKPVIGVPCSGNFDGMDALLSIIQMPGGIPVLCVGINNPEAAADNAELILKEYSSVNLVGDIKNKRVEKAVRILEDAEIGFTKSEMIKKEAININFVELGTEVELDGLVINVPLLDCSRSSDVSKMIDSTRKGLWVGLNRADNAAIASIEILNKDGKYDAELESYRRRKYP